MNEGFPLVTDDEPSPDVERDIMQDRDGFRESQRYAEGLGGPEFADDSASTDERVPSEQEIRLMAIDVARNLPASNALDLVDNAIVVAEYLRTGAVPTEGAPSEAAAAPLTASTPDLGRPAHHQV